MARFLCGRKRAVCAIYLAKNVSANDTVGMKDESIVADGRITLAHRLRRGELVQSIFERHEPAQIMFLLAKSRKQLNRALDSAVDTQELTAITTAVCRLAETSARFARIPLAPKGQPGKPGDNAKPILPMD